MKKILLYSLGIVAFLSSSAQAPKRSCGTMESLKAEIAKDPSLELRMQQLEQQTQNYILNQGGSANKTAALVTIPVVVHILYKNPSQNLSAARIQTQIDVLNKDYSKTNSDTNLVPSPFKALIGDAQIQFALAVRDPQGLPTTGITRTPTTISSFDLTLNQAKYTSLGGHDAWDRNSYLNLWVVPDINNAGVSGILGYAQPPGGAAATDGVVIGYQYFGTTGASAPFNKGRTCTHEVGHWLNLRHIWGTNGQACGASDDDAVTDTPKQTEENYGCPTFPLIVANVPAGFGGPSCSGTTPGSMFMNYMDYVDDACMQMFSIGQVTRMTAAVNGPRATLFNSQGLVPVVLQTVDAALNSVTSPTTGSSCSTSIIPSFTLNNFGTDTLKSVTINYELDGGTAATQSWTGSLVSLGSSVITLPALTLTPGFHNFLIYTSNPNGATDLNTSNDSVTVIFTTVNPPTSIAITSGNTYVEGFQNATFPPTGWTRNNPNNNNTWTRVGPGGFGNSTFSARMDNYSGSSIAGQIDELNTPTFDLSTGGSNYYLTFSVAYAQYDANSPDSLIIFTSTDCDQTWVRRYGKGKGSLATNGGTFVTAAGFVPSASQWRTETVNLSSLQGASHAKIRFQNKSGFGNWLYVDDVNVTTSPLSVSNGIEAVEGFAIYPNPSNGIFTLTGNFKSNGKVSVKVFNMLGKVVYNESKSEANNQNLTIDLSAQSKGVYFVEISNGNENVTKRISIIE
ncbi:MAG: T9SS type A sorting domain-containing protein [Bacteroidetes bacterium]|nr:T9SS type A sorting domain-containing protein [Bacteroidota bacterium]